MALLVSSQGRALMVVGATLAEVPWAEGGIQALYLPTSLAPRVFRVHRVLVSSVVLWSVGGASGASGWLIGYWIFSRSDGMRKRA